MLEIEVAGFPVHIHLSFLLIGIIVLDSGLGGTGIVLWMVVAFASILLHELGHAYVARRSGGLVDHITIYAMGGLTHLREDRIAPLTSKQRVLISAAGPLTGIVTGLAAYGAIEAGVLGRFAADTISNPWDVHLFWWAVWGEWHIFVAAAVVWISLIWGAVNLLPIGGFDGSHILAELLERRLPGRGRVVAAHVGLAVAAVAAVWTYQQGFRFAPLIFLVFAVNDLAWITRQKA